MQPLSNSTVQALYNPCPICENSFLDNLIEKPQGWLRYVVQSYCRDNSTQEYNEHPKLMHLGCAVMAMTEKSMADRACCLCEAKDAYLQRITGSNEIEMSPYCKNSPSNACRIGDIEFFKELKQKQPDILTLQCPLVELNQSFPLLSHAVFYDQIELVQWMLEAGFSKAESASGVTPFKLAVELGYVDIVIQLLQHECTLPLFEYEEGAVWFAEQDEVWV